MEKTQIMENVVEKLYTLWSTPTAALLPTPLETGNANLSSYLSDQMTYFPS